MVTRTHIPKSNYNEGVKLCEVNAFESFTQAQTNLDNSKFREAYLLGFIALEEIGKALFILDEWDKPSISKNDWRKSRTFLNHISKLMRTRKSLIDDLILTFREQSSDIKSRNIHILGWSVEEMKQLWLYRNRVMFVGYDFKTGQWESPKHLMDLEEKASDVISRARLVFSALETVIQEHGLTPEWTEILSATLEI